MADTHDTTRSEQKAVSREDDKRRRERLIVSLLRLIDAVPYRDATGLRLGDAVPVVESMRGEVADGR